MDKTAQACLALGRELSFEEGHCCQDARLAVRLFDLTSELHGLDDRCRELLYLAGLLHDIGYVEGYWGHHKTAYRLIMKAELPGLDEREQRMVASIARYHRGGLPKPSHDGWGALEEEDREMVAVLGALLRLADGLDRSHTDAVQDLDAWIDGDSLTLLLDCPYDCGTEVWAGEKKGRWLGQVLGLEIRVRQRVERD